MTLVTINKPWPLPKRPNVVVHQAEFAGGQLRAGVDEGPQALVDHGLPDLLTKQLGLQTSFQHVRIPDTSSPKETGPASPRNAANVGLFNNLLSANVHSTLTEHRAFPLTLGGDHSTAIGSVSGTASAIQFLSSGQRSLKVVWIDAHADINTPVTSGSGNMHGMPAAFLTRIADAKGVVGFEWMEVRERIGVGDLVYVGLRDVDEAEKEVLEGEGIKAFWVEDVQCLGIEDITHQILEFIGDQPVHIQFDIDALDPSIARATGFPVEGGLTLDQAGYLLTGLRETGQVVALDVVEVNPRLSDCEGVRKTLDAGLKVVEWVLGDGHD